MGALLAPRPAPLARIALALFVAALPAAGLCPSPPPCPSPTLCPPQAQWTDGLEDYADGSPLEGQGGWHGWDGDDTWHSLVTSNLAQEGGQSVLVQAGADTVREFSGHDWGKWLLRCQLYLPSSFVGKTYFLVLNDYQDQGPYQWSVQIGFNGDSGLVECDCGTTSTITLPLVLDQWTELRCEIDIGADWVDVYYDGTLVAGYAWSAGVHGLSQFTELGIEALDLYPDEVGYPHVSEVYFDAFELSFFSGSVGTAYCFGDGTGNLCPCGNLGGSEEGCANSTGAGARLAGLGSPSVAMDDLVCDAAGLVPGQPALLFAGLNAVNGGDGIPFGDGLRCAGGSVTRLGVKSADAAGGASWGPGLGASGGWVAGDTRRLQAWYRDPTASPCGGGFNLSNGLEVVFLQ